MMPVDPPPSPYIPVGGSEGDQPRDRVRGVPRGPLTPATLDAGDVERRAVIQQAAEKYLSDFDTVMNVRSEARDIAVAIDRALASRDAATADRVRRETAEGIAAAIEAKYLGPDSGRGYDGREAPDAHCRNAYDEGLEIVAPLAREAGR